MPSPHSRADSITGARWSTCRRSISKSVSVAHSNWSRLGYDARGMAKRASPIPNRLTLGIDEAGRGPAIGPMVMAAVAIDSKAAAALTRKGLCDSKAYGAGEEAQQSR